MIRKWMAMLLSLVLALSVCMSALADMQHTLSVEPGEMLASEEVIADLLDVVSIRLTEGEKSGAVSLLLNETELVTLGLTADVTGLYASSGLLGSDVMYITWDDGLAILGDWLTATAAEAGMDETAIQSLETSLAEIKTAIAAQWSAGSSASLALPAPETMEESLQTAEQMFPDDPEMVEYIRQMTEKMTVEDGSFAAEGRDMADQKYRMVMDSADLAAVCDTEYMKSTLMQTLSAEHPDATAEELSQAADELAAEVTRIFTQSDFELIMEMYALNEEQALVGADFTMNMTMKEDEQIYASQMVAGYDRLTDAEGVSYKADFLMEAEGETVSLAFDLNRAFSGKSTGKLGMLAGGEEIVVIYEAENTAADTRVRKAELYMRSGATAILQPAASARPVIALVITSEPASAETLAALEKATPETSVNVMDLSDAQMRQLGSQITANAQQALFTALGQLPTSTLQLLLSSNLMGW